MFLCGLYSPVTFADVTVERYFTTGGISGMGAFQSNDKESIKGLQKHVDSEKKMESKLMYKKAKGLFGR
jgi:hypothetical protein